MPTVLINVIDVREGKIVGRIHSGGTCLQNPDSTWEFKRIKSPLETMIKTKKFTAEMDQVSAIHYSKSAHQIVTGHRYGNLVIWR